MKGSDNCTFTCLTPAGRGAVATLVVDGPGALDIVIRFFQPSGTAPLQQRPRGTITYGRWKASQESTGEDVVACARSNEEVEIHCHGGAAAVGAITDCLAACGCEAIPWEEHVSLRQDDPIAADALALLANARTRQTAALLLDQYNGAFRAGLSRIHELLVTGDTGAALMLTQDILSRANAAAHLTRPWKVVFTGPPNVGKSCLVNALAGFQRAIVHDAPGTTRDVLHVTVALGGWLVELTDTAGITETADPIEAAGIQLARLLPEEADVIVHVSDASTETSPLPGELASVADRLIRVANKCDLAPASLKETKTNEDTLVRTIATTGEGVALLGETIVARFPPMPPSGSALPLNQRWRTLLDAVRNALDASEEEKAMEILISAAPGTENA